MKKLIKSILPEKFIKAYQQYRRRQFERSFEGDDVICSICSSTYKRFRTYGRTIKRENAKCPNCGSLERHRLLWRYLQDKDLLKNSIRVLHIAPEQVFYDIFDGIDNIEYIPGDLFPENFDFPGKTAVVKVDITDIPFESDYFDFILCSHVLEHIPDDRLAMSELHRVMKKTGFGILQVPIDYNRDTTYEDPAITSPEEREKVFGQDNHVRIYGRDYKDRLTDAGFVVKEDDFVGSFSAEDQFKYGFMSDELIYYCTKSQG